MGYSYFKKISEILLEDSQSWQGKGFLTFDIDWARDQVFSHTIDLVENADVAATWFVTHETPLLERLRSNPKFELGIHPNFLSLLNQNQSPEFDAKAILKVLQEIVPEAVSLRSHSLLQSTQLSNLFAQNGIVYDCNYMVPASAGIELKPWRQWNNLVRVPYFWEDSIHIIQEVNDSMENLVSRPGIRVFNFHPIHVFLNTENVSRYEQSRPFHKDWPELNKWRNTGPGINSMLNELLDVAQNLSE